MDAPNLAGGLDILPHALVANQPGDHQEVRRPGGERYGRESARSMPEPLIRTIRWRSPMRPKRSEQALVVGVLEEHDVDLAQPDPVKPSAAERDDSPAPVPGPPPRAEPIPVIMAARIGTPARRAAIDP